MKIRFGMLVFIGSLVLVPASGLAETTPLILTTADTPVSTVMVEGTTTIQSWGARSDDVGGTVTIDREFWTEEGLSMVPELFDTDENPDVRVEFAARSLESGIDGQDADMYEALRVEEYPTISYTLSTAEVGTVGERFTMNTSGILTARGTEVELKFPVEVEFREGRLRITGRVETRLTEFEIEPPTALFGLIRTRDEIELSFEWYVAPVWMVSDRAED